MSTCSECGGGGSVLADGKSVRCPICRGNGTVFPRDLQLFDVEGYSIRFGVGEDRRPYSVASDYAKAMRYAKTQNATDLLDEDEKGYARIVTPGGPQRLAVIYEDGMWELIFRSTLPGAKAIKKRVKAILGEIRETGSYGVAARREPPKTYAAALRELADSEDEKDRLRGELAEAKPKAHSWDVLASGRGDYSVADAAKILSRDPAISIGERRLFAELYDAGWIYRQRADGRWRVYQAQIDNNRMSELPQKYENKRTGEMTLGAPHARIKIKGLRELHHQLGGAASLRLHEQLAIEGGA
jgi:anti-repressor protein